MVIFDWPSLSLIGVQLIDSTLKEFHANKAKGQYNPITLVVNGAYLASLKRLAQLALN